MWQQGCFPLALGVNALTATDSRGRLQGVLVYLVTPFLSTADLPLDEKGLIDNVQFLLDNNVSAVVACGGTGEYWSLAEEEYRRVLTIVKDRCSATTLVIAAVGGSLQNAVRQTVYAEACGCDAITLLSPLARVSESGHVQYAKAVAAVTSLPIVVYVSTPVSDTALAQLLEIENVAALKDTTGDLWWFRRSIRFVGERANWIAEAESTALYYLLHGAAGFTSGVANFAPALSLELYNACRSGNYKRAAMIQRALDPFAELRAKSGNQVPVVKAALDLIGQKGGPVRLPLMDLSAGDRQELERLIASLPTTVDLQA